MGSRTAIFRGLIMNRTSIIAALLLSLAGLPSLSAQGLMDDKIPEFRAPQGQEFEMLCMLKNIPCGFEEASDDGKEPEILPVLSLSSTTVHGVLDAITARYPRYEWRMESGVLNLLPREKAGKARRGAAYSSATLKPFSFEERPLPSALTRLCALADNGCAAATAAGFAKEAPTVTLAVSKGDTVAHVLNAIAMSQGNASWSVLVSGKDTYQITLKRWDAELGQQLLGLLMKESGQSIPVTSVGISTANAAVSSTPIKP